MPKSFLVRNYFKNENEDEMNNAVETSEVEELKLPQALENSHLSGVDSLPDLFESLEHARSLLALSRSVPWDYEIEKSYWFDTQNSHVTSSHNNDIIPSSSSEKSDSPSSHYGDVFQDLSKTEIDNIEKAATSIVSVIRSADLACRNDHGMVKTAEEAIIEEKPKNKTYLQMVCEALPLPPKMDFVDFPKIVVESEESSESLDSWSDLELKLQQMLSEENEQVSKNIRQFLDNNRIVTDEVAVETGMEKCDIDGFVDNCNDMELENKKELYRWYLTKILRPPTEHDDSYTCYKCGKIFTYKNYLERHIKYVCPDSTGRTWKCGYCGKAFQYPCYLRRHIRSHTGESPYKCDKCDRAFVRSTDLQRHIRNHTGEKPYQCTQCSRAFARSTDLKRHMRTHTGEKPYKCWQCRKSFSQSGSLQTHLQTHNKEMAKRSKQPTPNKSCRGTGL